MIPPGHIDRHLVLEAAALLETAADAWWVDMQWHGDWAWTDVRLSRDWFDRAEAVAAELAKQCARTEE